MSEYSRSSRRPQRSTPEGSPSQRQGDFLAFQIFIVILLLSGVWATQYFKLSCYDGIRRLSALLDAGTQNVLQTLEIDGVWESFVQRLDLAEDMRTDGKGGVYPGNSATTLATPPRGSTFSPLLLSAQPKIPVSGTVTSAFGWRDNPLSPGNADFHTGLDIAAPEGTPIFASLPGTVSDIGTSANYGQYIRVMHTNGLETFYCHCSAILAIPGAVIRQGERIALVGSTGRVTGPHLHFEIQQNALSSDPLSQLIQEDI